MAITNNVKKEIISARCSPQVKGILNLLSQTEELSMSEVITKSILEYYKRHSSSQSLLETERELFGKYGSSKGDLSIKRGHYLKEILNEKHGHS